MWKCLFERTEAACSKRLSALTIDGHMTLLGHSPKTVVGEGAQPNGHLVGSQSA